MLLSLHHHHYSGSIVIVVTAFLFFVFLLYRGLPHPVLPLPTDVWSSSLLPRVRRRAVLRKGPLACVECRSALLRYALLLLLIVLLGDSAKLVY